MNILLDTNIIIPLEDTGRILNASFAELRKLAAEQQHCLYVHPLQIDDINRDKDKGRKIIVLSRLKQYSKIENPPVLSDLERERLRLKESNDNDKVDINILFVLYRGAVNVLVTNHEGIHKKASNVGIHDKVISAGANVAFLKTLFQQTVNAYLHRRSGTLSVRNR